MADFIDQLNEFLLNNTKNVSHVMHFLIAPNPFRGAGTLRLAQSACVKDKVLLVVGFLYKCWLDGSA